MVYSSLEKGHGRKERRTLELSLPPESTKDWRGLKVVARMNCERERKHGGEITTETGERYFICSIDDIQEIFRHIRHHWGVENCVHYVRDVTFGEDKSRIRKGKLPESFAAARNFAVNLFRKNGYKNMAQAIRKCSGCFTTLASLMRMK